MLFMVPDSPSRPDPEAEVEAQVAPKEKETSNVELDLEDAPFLEEPEPEPELALPMPPPSAPAAAKVGFKARLLANKKKLILAGVSLSLFLVAFIGVNFFLFKPPPEQLEVPPEKVEEKPQEVASRTVVVPATPPLAPAPAVEQFQTAWAPFVFPLKGYDGETVLFTLALVLPTDSPGLHAEVQARQTVLRDGVYYFLRQRSFEELIDKTQFDELRSNIVNVINEHLTTGKLEAVYVEDFFAEHL